MKQTITKEQWDEFSDEEKLSYYKELRIKSIPYKRLSTIGQYIEFLGEDLWKITREYTSKYLFFS